MKKTHNIKMLQPNKTNVSYKLRIWHNKKTKKQTPSYTIKCGDCTNKLKIYYDEEILEIGGVLASISEWRKLLLPLLTIKKKIKNKRN